MKKLLCTIGLAALVASCASNKDNTVIKECYYPDNGQSEAPLWVCGASFGDYPMLATGSYPKTGAGVDFQRTLAANNARAELAARFKTDMVRDVERFINAQGVEMNEQVDQYAKSVTQQFTDNSLFGSQILRTATNPTSGVLYALVGMNTEDISKTEAEIVRKAQQTDAPLWEALPKAAGADQLVEFLGQDRNSASLKY